MEIESFSFAPSWDIPVKYTCDGDNVSPAFRIKEIPSGTRSIALVMDDPDATGGGTFTHWILWNISPEIQKLEEDSVPAEVERGTNDFGAISYGGPCPPRGGKKHRYMFKFYALDIILVLPTGSLKAELEEAMDEHVLDTAVVMGLYGR